MRPSIALEANKRISIVSFSTNASLLRLVGKSACLKMLLTAIELQNEMKIGSVWDRFGIGLGSV